MTATTDPYREWDAAYVLGALGPAERREFEEHLAGCDACRAAVTELAGVPGLLASVPVEHALAAGPRAVVAGEGDDGDLADVVPLAGLAGAARRSRRRRRTLTVAAASALLVAGVGAGLALGPGSDGPGSAPSATTPVAQGTTVDLEPVGAVEVRASLTATARPWGTSLEWSCTYPPRSGAYDPPDAATYTLVLVDHDGGRTVAATWTGSGTASTGLGAASALPLDRIQRVEIARAGGETLASAPL
ncbi:anti-sigma factor family protein [Krasilnikoviella flava]|uniref:Putative zinc-finger n=1 Tax=Krasilnikoviella flava TaxID=526729 RepID=A0A1T5K125_9MICO|nr:zf-HC2 domain-containing protein [Krasilnikoviella flava]SKC57366.1 Putative zinc-finger [Krasilnikoviella flava]